MSPALPRTTFHHLSSLLWSRTSRGLALVEPKPCSFWPSVWMHARPGHTHVPVHAHSHARDFVHRCLRITVPPTGSSSCRALHSCARRATKAKAELSVVPVSRHIWPTAPIGRAPRHATVELAAVAKPPVCPRAHALTGGHERRLWLAQCLPPHTLLPREQEKSNHDSTCDVAFASPLLNLTALLAPAGIGHLRRAIVLSLFSVVLARTLFRGQTCARARDQTIAGQARFRP
jgi:hypothetical protein